MSPICVCPYSPSVTFSQIMKRALTWGVRLGSAIDDKKVNTAQPR